MIKLEHVSKAYSAGIPALNDFNLEIDDGEFVFVCGDSGSGKSTLIKLLLKELDPTDGMITVDGRNLAKKNIPCPLNMTLLQRKSKCAVIVVSKTRLGIFVIELLGVISDKNFANPPAAADCI